MSIYTNKWHKVVSPLRSRKTQMYIGYLFLALLYWLMARFVQGSPNPYYRTTVDSFIRSFPIFNYRFIPDLMVFGLSLIEPTVLRHFIPVVGGVSLGRVITTRLLKNFHDLPTQQDANKLWNRLRNGTGAEIKLNPTTFAEDKINNDILRIGGPGYIKLPLNHAAVTERNGQYHRVLLPDNKPIHLDPFETVTSLLDLREQELILTDIPVTTKEGFDILVDAAITYRIRRTSHRIANQESKADKEALRTLAYKESIVENQVRRWTELPKLTAIRGLRHNITTKRLDTLLKPPTDQEITNQLKPHPELQANLHAFLTKELDKIGIEILTTGISTITFPENINKIFSQYWSHFGDKIRPIPGVTPLSAYSSEDQRRTQTRQKLANQLAESLERNRSRPNPFPNLIPPSSESSQLPAPSQSIASLQDSIANMEIILEKSLTDPTLLTPDAQSRLDSFLADFRKK